MTTFDDEVGQLCAFHLTNIILDLLKSSLSYHYKGLRMKQHIEKYKLSL